MRRRKDDWGYVGFAMVAVGIVVVVAANIREFDLVGIGRMLVIVGAVLAVYAKLKMRVGPIHDAWLDGRDVGREEGYEDGFRDGQKAKPERPKLIDLDAHREHVCNPDPASQPPRRTSRRGDEE